MERTEILSLFKNTPADGTEITVCGWAKNIRDSKNIGFIALSDGGCFKTLQVVLEAGKLVARMDELGMDKTNYEWYLNLRKFGGVEHAGYGLGFERMIMYLTGIQNIRDVLPFPRTAYGF